MIEYMFNWSIMYMNKLLRNSPTTKLTNHLMNEFIVYFIDEFSIA